MAIKKRAGLKKYFVGLVMVGKVVALAVFFVSAIMLARFFLLEGKDISPAVESFRVISPEEVQNPIANPAIAEIQEPTASSEMAGEWLGLCEKEIIHSVADFHRTVQKDPTLLKHFAGFNWETAKLGKQDKEIFAFVAYRKGDVIRRTTKPIRLPIGDGYITDGVRIARTYCCNDYVIPPAGSPSAGRNLDEESILSPADPVELIEGPRPPEGSPSAGGGKEVLSYLSPSFYSNSPLGHYPFYKPPVGPSIVFLGNEPEKKSYIPLTTTSAPVPEPGSMLLISTGLAGVAVFRRKEKS